MALTESGQRCYEHALEILTQYQRLVDDVTQIKTRPEGMIRIGCSFGFGRSHIAPAITELMRNYPELQDKAFNWHLPEDDARTVNGVILEALEEIPVAGTRVRIGEYDIDILDVQDNMIKQVKVFPVKPLRESVAE